MFMKTYDYCVIGAGIAGIAIAELLQRSGQEVCLIEKNYLVGSGASSQLQGWFHTGALYAALPKTNHLKTMAGNVDDMVRYYSCFENMNLGVGSYIYTKKTEGWFRNDLNSYLYTNPSELPFYLRPAWYIAIRNAVSRMEKLNHLGYQEDLSDRARKISSSAYHSIELQSSEVPAWIGKGKHFLSRDRTMDTRKIMVDLLASYLAHGGILMTGTNAEDSGNGLVAIEVEPNIFDISIQARRCVISTVGCQLPSNICKNVYSPLMVTYPNIADINIIRMSPIISDTRNHLVHSINNERYSLLGDGSYFETPAEAIEKCKLIDIAKELNVKYKIYAGVKTEVMGESMLRNYQYQMIDKGRKSLYALPGKFTLGFSLAVNTCRKFSIDASASHQFDYIEARYQALAESLVDYPYHERYAKELMPEWKAELKELAF